MVEIVHSAAEMAEALHNDAVCKDIGGAIMKAYPDRKWYVEILDKGFVCFIKIPDISMEYGVTVLLKKHPRTDIPMCVKGAGELLERFALTRGKTDNVDLISLARDYKGVIGASKGELQ